MHSWKKENPIFQSSPEGHKMEAVKNPPSWKAWLFAMRPQTLSASIVPMVVGSAFAYSSQGSISYLLTICAIISAMLIQIGTNLVNDALDYKKGADTEKRLGPQRATASGWLTPSQVLAIGVACLFVAIACGIPLIMAGGWPLLWVVLISAVMGYLYTGGPKPLSYNGLGDLFVFLFFGLVATGAIYYVQTQTLTWEILLAGAQIGLSCSIMIAINNLRDIEEDSKTEKRTLAVRFGKNFARYEINFLTLAPYFLGYIWWKGGYPSLALWPLASLPLAISILTSIKLHEPSRAYNVFLGQASVLHLLWGICLTAAAIL